MNKGINEKNSTDSFLSGHDTFLKDDSGFYDNKDEKIEVLRKKLKILKGALIKERQAKGLVDQEANEYRRKNQLLQAELDEKEKTTLKLHKEIDELQEKLITERMNIEKYRKNSVNVNPSSLPSSIFNPNNKQQESGILNNVASFFSFGNAKPEERTISSPNSTAQTNENPINVEYGYLKKQHDALLDKYKKTEDSVDSIKRDFKYETDKLEKKYEKIQNDYNEKDIQFKNLTQDYRNSCLANLSLLDEKEKLEKEINRLQEVNEKISHEKYQMNCLIEEKEKTLNELHDLVITSQQATTEMTEKIASLNQIIFEIENKIQIFKLYKIGNVGSLTKTPIQMILRRNLDGIYIMEFENLLSDKWAIDGSDVLDLIPAKEKENKFSLVYLLRTNQNQKETETFESEEDVTKICKFLKRFLQNAIEFRKKNPEKTLILSKKEGKKFFTDIVSFFGN